MWNLGAGTEATLLTLGLLLPAASPDTQASGAKLSLQTFDFYYLAI